MKLFYISHFLQAFFLPPGLNLLLGLLGLLAWRFSQTFSLTLIVFSFTSLWLLSTPIIAWNLIERLQRQHPVLKLDKPKEKSAIVVLGGGHGKSPEYLSNQTVSFDTLARLQYAAYLYEKTQLPIIVSGGNHEADVMMQVLKENFKIPAQWEETESINTADEAKFLIPILKQHDIKTIYLITNAWHMPRSIYIFNLFFKPAGLQVIPAPTRYEILDKPLHLFNYLPSLGALNTSSIALHEYIGMVWYQIFYNRSIA